MSTLFIVSLGHSLTRHQEKSGRELLEADNSLASEASGEENEDGTRGNRSTHFGGVSNRGGSLLQDDILSRVILAGDASGGGAGGIVFECEFL